MNDNHKLEDLLAEMAREPIPQDVHALTASIVRKFRGELAAGAAATAANDSPGDRGPAQPEAVQEEDRWANTPDVDATPVRLVPDVPTERADRVPREDHPISTPDRRHAFGRFTVMLQSRKAKWSFAAAAAAAIVLAVGFWPHQAGRDAGSAFAVAIRQFREARTIVCNVSGAPGDTVVGAVSGKLYVSAEQGSRLEMLMGPTPMMIMYSSPQGAQTIVNPPLRTYTVIESPADAPAGPPANSADGFIVALAKLQGQATRELGRQVVDGVDSIGYEIAGELLGIGKGDEVRSELWIDAATYLPVRYVAEMPMSGFDGRYQLVYDRFEWDTPLDPQLFVPQIPSDYTRLDAKPPAPDESALIQGLGNYAELTGKYPPKLDASTMVTDFSTALGRRLGAEMARGGKVPDQKTIMQKSVEIGSGITYYQQLVREGREPQYHGTTVQPGQADAVLLQWTDAEGRLRIVYGDLRVETRDVR